MVGEENKIIDANDKSVRQVLDKVKYTLDVFQREYRWERRQIEQLIDDLTTKFLSDYNETDEREDVANYGKYYLGSIVTVSKNGKKSIIDGQQRLTSLTLLLTYLHNLQRDKKDIVNIDELVYSVKFAKKSFNLQIEEREKCMETLWSNSEYNSSKENESVKNMVERYNDIKNNFPPELNDRALPYFIDWLTEHVIFVEIETFSDEDAYIIFETLNDRGLSLSPTEMLKGYLISNLGSDTDKIRLNELWKERILALKEIDKEEDLEFFKAWLRAKYADTIRQGKKGSENEDFEKIGTRFHSWVKDKMKLKTSLDFYKFIEEEFKFYVDLYIKIDRLSKEFSKKYECVYYIEKRDFAHTFSFPILMAPIKLTDTTEVVDKKLAIVARFLEMFSVFRSVNHRTLSYSSIRYTMFSLVKDIRDKDVNELTKILKEKVNGFEENLNGMKDLELNSQNKRFIHFLLARITSYIEEQSGMPNKFVEYMNKDLEHPFEVEHIWSDKFDEHTDEFSQRDEWEKYRNRIGALILLPQGFNQSYGALPYDKKISHYFGQNLLAKTLSEQCYERNPNFLVFKSKYKLPFNPHKDFKRKDIDDRQMLYQRICEQIYNIEEFEKNA